jgi:DNA polymerase I
MAKPTKLTKKAKQLLISQCAACPFKDQKGEDPSFDPVDILIISNKEKNTVGKVFKNYSSLHVFLTECLPLNKAPDNVSKYCCLGRKLDMITALEPKLVIAVGFDVYKELEAVFGYDVPTKIGTQLMPTRYDERDFWFVKIPDNETIKSYLQDKEEMIEYAMTHKPKVLEGNLEGVEFCMTEEQIENAFLFFQNFSHAAIDIETTGLRPYYKDSRILSIAISVEGYTAVFPLFHSQTPSDYPVQLVIKHLKQMTQYCSWIAHNLVFELEWLAKLIDPNLLYSNKEPFHDTMAQAYLLSSENTKNLDDCIRRAFGFNLKRLSDIDVANLDNEPLEKVLAYNAMDAKYTYMLFPILEEQIKANDLERAYQLQIERIPAIAAMQLKGLVPNIEFIEAESIKPQHDLIRLNNEFNTYQEVKELIETDGADKCKPLSNPFIKKLMSEKLHIYKGSFEDDELATIDHPLAATLRELRMTNKFWSTYLLPFNKSVEGGGTLIYDDGLVHTAFNSMNTVTGRLSSSAPNSQNLPKRGGKEYLRNVFKAPAGKKWLSFDLGQIEARIIASLAKDKALIDAIKNDYDVHMHWAKRLIEYLPDFFKVDPNDPSDMKAFRGEIKTNFVFPLFYGSSYKNVLENINIRRQYVQDLMPIFNEFWDMHSGVRPWQKSLETEHNTRGFITSPFGRKYWAPISWNKIINYPVQGCASDVLVIAMARLAKLSWELGEPDLCPIINIHDCLDFYIQEDLLEDFIPLILDKMLDVTNYKDWLLVPLTVEAAIGDTWGALEHLATYSSDAWNTVAPVT